MKILQLVQKPQLRGAEIFASQLSNALMAAGHDCRMLCLFEGDATLPFEGSVIFLDRPRRFRFFDLAGMKKIATHVNAYDPDVVQANAGDTLKYAVLSKIIFRWRQPIVYRNANMIGNFIDTKTKLAFNKFLVHRVEQVISVSTSCQQDFVATFMFPERKIAMVPIGIDFKPVGDVPDDLKEIYQKGPVLVNAASLVPEKNHKGLLAIFSRVVTQFPSAQLVVVGEGKLKAELQEQARALGVASSVHFLGKRTDVLEIIRHANLFLLPSLIEGLPAVILESFYCRTPVVAYNVGGISEVVKTGETGWLVKAGDENEFADVVLTVLHTDTASIKEKAYELVVKEFDNEVIARRFLEVYLRL